MASKKAFDISNIKNSKKFYDICPKFKDFMYVRGNKSAAYRSHPVSFHLPPIRIPKNLDSAISMYLRENVPIVPKVLIKLANSLGGTIWSRSSLNEKNLEVFLQKVEKANLKKEYDKLMNSESEKVEYLKQNIGAAMHLKEKQMKRTIKEKLNDLSVPNEYSTGLANLYLVNRVVPNFAACCKVFYEIRKRCPSFVPTSLFDFGSGIGSATWAANTLWPKDSIELNMMVDASRSFLAMSEYLIKDGAINQEQFASIRNVHYRAYLSSTNYQDCLEQEQKYDLVVSAFSLLDVTGGYLNRREILDNLWCKTKKFLVLIEHGNKNGFGLILEARDWLLRKQVEPAKIFSPCPHSFECPKQSSGCSFNIKHEKLRLSETHAPIVNERFSYIVLSKGDISQYYSHIEEVIQPFPRIVTHSGSGYKIQDICSPDGNGCRFYFSATDSAMKQMLKSCQPGDMMPVLKNTNAEEEEEEDTTNLDNS